MHLLNGLLDKYDSIINVIKHKSPFPSFLDARSMLQMEEDRLSKQVKPSLSNNNTSSAPAILYSSSDNRNRSTTNHNNGPNGQFLNNGNNGYYRGNRGRGRGGRNNRGRGPNWSHGAPQWPFMFTPSMVNGMVSPGYHIGPTPSFTAHHNTTQAGILGPPPSRPNNEAHLAQHPLSSLTPHPYHLLPANLTHAFNTMALQDPNDATWYLDTGATNHITSTPGNLRFLFNTSNLPKVTMGNGSLALVTSLGQGAISSPSHAFQLNNIFVCPSIIKNLISVRKFVTDNLCSIEFDPFDFVLRIYLLGPNFSDVTVEGHSTPCNHLLLHLLIMLLLFLSRMVHFGTVVLAIRKTLFYLMCFFFFSFLQ